MTIVLTQMMEAGAENLLACKLEFEKSRQTLGAVPAGVTFTGVGRRGFGLTRPRN